LAEEQTRGLYSFSGSYLSVELEELHEHVVRVESERTVEAVQLSRSEIFNALVDLGVFPIWDILAHPNLVQDDLMMASLILEHLREEHASATGPWV
jgi:hypothetical protein